MKPFKNQTLKAKLARIFLILTIINIASLGFTVWSLIRMGNNLDLIYKARLKSIDFLDQADRDGYQANVAITEMLHPQLVKNQQQYKKLYASMEENVGQVEERFGKFEKIYRSLSKENEIIFSQFHNNYQPWKKISYNIAHLLKKRTYDEALTLYKTSYKKHFKKFRDAMDKFQDISLNEAKNEYKQNMQLKQWVIAVSALVIILVVSLFMFFAVSFSKAIVSSFKVLTDTFSLIKQGDLSAEIEIVHHDETEAILNSLQIVVDTLSATLNSIKAVASLLANGSAEISTGAQQLAQGSNEQASAIEEIYASITEISTQAKSSLDTSSKIKDRVQQAQENALSGSSLMQEMVQAQQIINESSSKIAKIMKVIDELSFQTNLLALNAAVEAARAGNHGKGFAVVAEEINNLSKKSAESAHESARIIEESIQNITRGNTLANKSMQSFEQIIKDVSSVALSVENIENLINEQVIGIQQVEQGISQINMVTQQNAALAEENSASSEQLNSMAVNLSEELEKFKLERSDPKEQVLQIEEEN